MEKKIINKENLVVGEIYVMIVDKCGYIFKAREKYNDEYVCLDEYKDYSGNLEDLKNLRMSAYGNYDFKKRDEKIYEASSFEKAWLEECIENKKKMPFPFIEDDKDENIIRLRKLLNELKT